MLYIVPTAVSAPNCLTQSDLFSGLPLRQVVLGVLGCVLEWRSMGGGRGVAATTAAIAALSFAFLGAGARYSSSTVVVDTVAQ